METVFDETLVDAPYDQQDLIVNFTEAEHELLIDVLSMAIGNFDELIDFCALHDLPMNNPIVQKITMMENLKERLNFMWCERFNEDKNLQ